jgi:hypothetical protein
MTTPNEVLKANSTSESVPSPTEDASARGTRRVKVEDPLRAATGICIGIALALAMWAGTTVLVLFALH